MSRDTLSLDETEITSSQLSLVSLASLNSQQTSFGDLPAELLWAVFILLKKESAHASRSVSKRWNEIFEDEKLWTNWHSDSLKVVRVVKKKKLERLQEIRRLKKLKRREKIRYYCRKNAWSQLIAFLLFAVLYEDTFFNH
mmetsp:Transcript_3860/g.4277  ORF Transcript_3860/g.4277 Transcript_3860/m.4277 type:complete len:140 (+) Transcript_3860:153-572(+)